MGNIHSLNIGGSTYVIEPKTVKVNDVRGADRPTSYFSERSLTPWFNQNSGFDGTHWASGITMKGWTNDYQSWQLAAGSTSSLKSGLKFRNGINDTWQPWRKVILEGDTATNATTAITATKSQQTDNIAIHTKESIKDSGLCLLEGMYEVPVILGGCDCTVFSDQSSRDYFGLMTDYHPQNNNSSWLRYNFNDQTLKSTNFEGNLNGTATKINVKTSSHNYTYHIPLVPGSGSLVTYIDSTNGLKYNPGTKELYPATNNVMNLGRSNAFFKSMWIGNIYGAGIKSREIYSYVQYSDSSKPDICLIKIATINCRTVTNNWDYDCIEIPVYIRHLRSVIYLELTIEHNGKINPDKIELRYKGNLRSTIPSFYKGIKFWCTKVGSILTIWCEYGLDVKGGGSMNDPSVNIYNIKHHNYNITIDLPTTLTTYNGTLSEFKTSYTIYGAAPNNIEVANVNSSQTNFCHSIAVVSSSQYTNLTYKDPNTLYLII